MTTVGLRRSRRACAVATRVITAATTELDDGAREVLAEALAECLFREIRAGLGATVVTPTGNNRVREE